MSAVCLLDAPSPILDPVISTECRDGIPIVRLDRADHGNAMVPELLSALVDHLRNAASNNKPVVLTGSAKTFCTGADLHWLASLHDPAIGVADLVAVHHLAITTMVEMPVPVIAAVNGAAAGGGLGLALAADYCIAAERATFTAAYFRLGLTPDGGASAFLERTIGPGRTRELLLTNRRLSAREAYDWGIVNRAVRDDELLEEAIHFAASLEPVPPYALLQTRRLLDASYLRNQLQLESVAIRTAARGEFFKAALRRFTEGHRD
jgi:2-(1,2-epoxy-1,2-dihydrophenyl)acetyl-CoA isomerase